MITVQRADRDDFIKVIDFAVSINKMKQIFLFCNGIDFIDYKNNRQLYLLQNLRDVLLQTVPPATK